MLALLLLLSVAACKKDKTDDPTPTTAPVVSSFTPTSGPAGTVVTITGTGFTGTTAVLIGGVAAVFTVVNATTLTATVAAGATTGPISITTPVGTGASTTPFTTGAITGATVTVPCADITVSATWADVVPGDAADYLVTCPISVTGNAVLTVAPGVKILFDGTTSGLFTSDNAGLMIVGTAAAPIKLIGKNPVRGSWKGIYFGSNNPSNQLAFATVLHAGGAESGVTNQKGAVQITRGTDGRGSIKNCTISESDGYGIYVSQKANLFAFSTNTITNNVGAPVGISFESLDKLDAASDYLAGNGLPFIDEYDTEQYSGVEIARPMTLVKLNVPYRVAGRIYLKALLTIKPGVVMEFNTGGELTTTGFLSERLGSINAVGTAAARIVFRGVQRAQGAWKGIALTTNLASNALVFCDISDGGSDELYGTYTSDPTRKANVVVGNNDDPCRATIQNCSLTNSLGFGLLRKTSGTAATVTQAGNTFTTNASGNVGTY